MKIGMMVRRPGPPDAGRRQPCAERLHRRAHPRRAAAARLDDVEARVERGASAGGGAVEKMTPRALDE